MTASDFVISDAEALLLRKILAQVLTQRVFFSLGEMTTITTWMPEDVTTLVGALEGRRCFLHAEEQRFLVFVLGAWSTAVRKGRVVASPAEVEMAQRLNERRRRCDQQGQSGGPVT